MLKNCSVTFVERPNGVYYSGEHVTGFINLILNEPKRVTDLMFQSEGVSLCQWSCLNGRYATITYSATVNHYSLFMTLLNCHTRDPQHQNTVLLGAGSHSFPFSVTLPEILPTTFESETGHVRYMIKVKAVGHLEMDEEYKMAFTVISKCDLNFIPQCNLPATRKVRKSFNSLFSSKGVAEMTVSLPVSGFLPGQEIPITYSINNKSKLTIQEITFTFRMIVTYTALEPHKKTKVKEKDLVVYAGQGVAKMSESACEVSFPVPAVPPSTIMKNQPVTIEYVLKVKAAVALFHGDPTIHIPVIIGNVPFKSSSSQNEPGASGGDSQYNLPPSTYEACHETNEIPSVVSFNNQHNDFHYTPMYPVYHFPQ